jgi:hypothetical protein
MTFIVPVSKFDYGMPMCILFQSHFFQLLFFMNFRGTILLKRSPHATQKTFHGSMSSTIDVDRGFSLPKEQQPCLINLFRFAPERKAECKRFKLDTVDSIYIHKVLSDKNASASKKKLRFASEPDEIIVRYYTAEDLQHSWLSADDWAASQQAIMLEIQAVKYFDITLRGLEQFQNEETRMNQVQQGSSIRKSICLASREVNGCTIAAALSSNLSASDVKAAHEVAIVDACIAKHIHGILLGNDFEHRSRCTFTPSNSFSISCSNNSTVRNKDLYLVRSYGLFSRRRQTKRMHNDQSPPICPQAAD